jgi:hypothetical protein
MNYKLCEYLPHTEEFMFRFDDGQWIGIDLVNEFPNYKTIDYNNVKIYWKVINVLNNNKTINIDAIVPFSIYDLKHLKVNSTRHKDNKAIYIKATQTDYDKNDYNLNKKNDNAKLYKYLNKLYNNSTKTNTTLIV